jgi:inner membrane protein involved in colicin E2 resistance
MHYRIGSQEILKDIDDTSKYSNNFAPHVVLSDNAHNYQKYKRYMKYGHNLILLIFIQNSISASSSMYFIDFGFIVSVLQL